MWGALETVSRQRIGSHQRTARFASALVERTGPASAGSDGSVDGDVEGPLTGEDKKEASDKRRGCKALDQRHQSPEPQAVEGRARGL